MKQLDRFDCSCDNLIRAKEDTATEITKKWPVLTILLSFEAPSPRNPHEYSHKLIILSDESRVHFAA